MLYSLYFQYYEYRTIAKDIYFYYAFFFLFYNNKNSHYQYYLITAILSFTLYYS